MQQTVGRSVRYGRTAGRVPYVVLFAFFAWTWCPVPTGGLVKCIAAATVVVNVPNKDDRISDWTDDGDDRTFDWSIDEDDEDDDDDDVRSAAAAVLQQLDDDVYAGKMMAFFAKLNSLRRKHHEERRRKPESSFEPERHVPATASRPPHGDDPGIRVNDDLLLQQQKLSSLPPSTNTNRDRKYGFWPGDSRSCLETDDDATLPPQTRDRHGLAVRPRQATVQRPRDDGGGREPRDPLRRRRRRPTGYLHMGWDSARCVWRRYRRDEAAAAAAATDDDAGRELRRRWAREWLEDAARFWTAVVGLSVAALWSAFGSFHEPFCAAVVAAPPDAYARDVNRYLNTVPPHVVVTGRGKMFRYRPTAEERFLWKSAKKIAGFKV